ncbi:MAG TPA: winged helix-turn-helix domain-containing protein [Gaiellaceae bacterium]|nr:winged helix-turn-helix domain-containing protein [Gaiellaceae bacterium]
MSSTSSQTRPWTFVTNHAAVLLCLASDPELRTRDIADRVGITERAAQRIVADLVAEEYVTRRRVGRRNVYEVQSARLMRHRLARHRQVGAFLELMLDGLDLDDLEDAPS